MNKINKKMVIITGPTATGKTALGLELAKEFNGEIISADSRQVYKFMDIGTGKDLPENFKFQIPARPADGSNFKLTGTQKLTYGYYSFDSVPVWGLDIVKPDYSFNVAEWVDYAVRVIKEIRGRGKLPIIVGGTGQYIRSLLDPPETLGIPINQEIRNKLLSYSVSQLQRELIGIDRNKWELMNESDRNNPRRLVRAIEVGTPNQKYKLVIKNDEEIKEVLIICLTAQNDVLYKRIDERVEKRMEQGVVEEIRGLLERGYSWELPSMSSLGYREFRDYFLEPRTYPLEPIIQKWKWDEHNYARRQLTYLKKYFPQAHWFNVEENGWKEEIMEIVEKFVEIATLRDAPYGVSLRSQ